MDTIINKWFTYKHQVRITCLIVMIIISVIFDLFKNPEKEPVASLVVLILFAISWIPFLFKEQKK